MSDGQPPHLQFEEKEQEAYRLSPIVPPLPFEATAQQVEPAEVQQMRKEIADARVVVARIAQEGRQYGRGLIPTLWLVASPIMAILLPILLFSGKTEEFWLTVFLFASAVKLGQLTNSNEWMRSALSMPEVSTRWIGPLAEMLQWPSLRAKSIAKHLLTHLLPQMTIEDWGFLNVDQRMLLYQTLEPKRARQEADLQIALMRGLERIQDTDAIPYIEPLAHIFVFSVAQQRVRGAARLCQSALELAERNEAARLSALAMEAEQLDALMPHTATETENVPPELEALIADIRKTRENASQPGMRLPFLLASWCFIVPFTAFRSLSLLSEGQIPAALVWGGLAAAATQLHRLTLLPWQTESMKRLAEYDSVKGVGFLSEVLDWPDSSSQTAASVALTRLLPRLKASDAPLLNARQRLCLYRRLTVGAANRDHALILAILKAMEQVGDPAAVGYVTKLAQSRPLTVAQRRVVQAAKECLPYLQRRADLNENSQFLLRASQAEELSPHTLLRPASRQETAPEQLLRPRGQQGDE